MPLGPGVRLGPYEIVATIGAGGMGEVYRARDTKLNRDVAIKVLPELFANDADRLARFTREAQTLASLNHPNIAHIHGLEESAGLRALVMELVEGEDLSQRIARGTIPLDEALPIAKQIADALEAAHEQGIIHRDLKPANIKVRPDGTVKVLDFGLAKALEPAASSRDVSQSPTITSPAMTQVGVLLGTAAYMSPEQAAGKIVDKRTDVWALGVVLLEMLTGRPVFSGETVSHVLAAVLKSDPDWTTLPPHTPRSIRRLLRRSLEKDVKRRLHSAADARLEIDDAVAPSDAELSPIVPARRITRTAVTIATVIALLGSVAAAMMAPAAFRHWRETPQASRPIWLEVRPSAGNALGFNRNAPESDISPDGEKLAYSAVAPDGIRHVWLQRFDRPTPQRIDGTEGGGNPFWAPDSRWLGFVSSDKLMKVDTATGTSQTICDAPAFAGATWNQDGEIVFSADAAEGSRLLFRVRAVGGTPRPVTTADGSHAHRSPQFLPDGHHLLFQVDAPNPAGGVFVMDVDDARTKKKIRASNMPAVYAPTGHILFSEGTTLFAQSFDPRRLETIGEPIPIANGVSTEPTYSVSPSGVLTFRPPGQTEMTELTWFTRQGQTERTIGPRAGYQTLALSPDQRQVAVEKTDARTSETDISLIDAARSITSRFTLTHDRHEFPVWSADSARLLYASHRNGTIGIFVKPVAGGAEQTISVDANHPLDWSPDGHYVLYTNNNQNLFALSTTSGEKPIHVVDQGVQEAQFSPDGRWVAYSSTSFGREEVYVTAFPSSVQKRQISSSGGGQPRWPRRANEIIYLAPDGKLMSVPVKLGAEFEATTPVPLFAIRTNPGGVNQRHQYAVSEDGQRFLVSALVDELGSQSRMTVVLNWPSLLNK